MPAAVILAICHECDLDLKFDDAVTRDQWIAGHLTTHVLHTIIKITQGDWQ